MEYFIRARETKLANISRTQDPYLTQTAALGSEHYTVGIGKHELAPMRDVMQVRLNPAGKAELAVITDIATTVAIKSSRGRSKKMVEPSFRLAVAQ